MYAGLQVKYPLFLSDFNDTWIFLTDFFKYSNIKFQKIRLVGAELFHVDWRTDRHDEANSRFWQFFELAYKSLPLLLPEQDSLRAQPVV
jgi:hypothetical protein